MTEVSQRTLNESAVVWGLWVFRHGNHPVARERRRSGSRSRSPRHGDGRRHFTGRRDGERDSERRRRSRCRSNSRERRAPPEARVEHARAAVHYGGACAQTGEKVRAPVAALASSTSVFIHRALTCPLHLCPARALLASTLWCAASPHQSQSSARLWLTSDLICWCSDMGWT